MAAVTNQLSLINGFVICPQCNALDQFKLSSPERAECTNCNANYNYDGEILDFVDGQQRTALDDIDYDEHYSVEEQLFTEFKSLKKWTKPLFDKHFDKVMEIGAGTGGLTIGMLSDGNIGSALITDISPNMLVKCRKRVLQHDLNIPVLFATNNGETLNVRDETFDLIVAYFCVHHILHYEKFLASCYRALRPGGKALFVEPGLRFLRALYLCFSPEIKRMALDPENWDKLDFAAVLSVHRNMHFTLKYTDDYAVLSGLEDKHTFGRYEFERAGKVAGFNEVQTIPYGIADNPLYALRVYAMQSGASTEFIDNFIKQVEDELPGPFLLLDPHEAAPSLAFILRKSDLITKENGPNYDPVASSAPLLELENVNVFYDILIELPIPENGSIFRISGWTVSQRPIRTVQIGTTNKTISLQVGTVSRPDVLAHFHNLTTFRMDELLHSGFSRELPDKEAPLKYGDLLKISFTLDNGQLVDIDSQQKIKDDRIRVERH